MVSLAIQHPAVAHNNQDEIKIKPKQLWNVMNIVLNVFVDISLCDVSKLYKPWTYIPSLKWLMWAEETKK